MFSNFKVNKNEFHAENKVKHIFFKIKIIMCQLLIDILPNPSYTGKQAFLPLNC